MYVRMCVHMYVYTLVHMVIILNFVPNIHRQYPVGVLYDMMVKSSEELPWKIHIRYKVFYVCVWVCGCAGVCGCGCG